MPRLTTNLAAPNFPAATATAKPVNPARAEVTRHPRRSPVEPDAFARKGRPFVNRVGPAGGDDGFSAAVRKQSAPGPLLTSSSAARPVPCCPPPVENLYAARLDRMSGPELKAELAKQQTRLFVAEHGIRFDPVVAKDAEPKIALCQKEIASRQANPSSEYAKQVHQMSDTELRSEISAQQGRLWVSQHGIAYDPVTEKDAMAKLKIALAEASSRDSKVPVSSPVGMR